MGNTEDTKYKKLKKCKFNKNTKKSSFLGRWKFNRNDDDCDDYEIDYILNNVENDIINNPFRWREHFTNGNNKQNNCKIMKFIILIVIGMLIYSSRRKLRANIMCHLNM